MSRVLLGRSSLHTARPSWTRFQSRRTLLTLAIETSCDDTSVAVLSKSNNHSDCRLHFHEKVTADNSAFAGIHPAVAVASHQQNLSSLVHRSLRKFPPLDNYDGSDINTHHAISVRGQDGVWLRKRRPDFISVTRGPGITAALASGLDTAKGLAVAFQVDLVAVNHMQAHALTPRLVCALRGSGQDAVKPGFPYLSLLVSGGHTLLAHSRSVCEHSIIASTTDIAIGDAIDKMARSILPPEELNGADIMYGRVLEHFAFEAGIEGHAYTPPRSRSEEITPRRTHWGWALPIPLAATRDMKYTFSGLVSAVKRICDMAGTQMGRAERVELAREGMRVAFEHLAIRVVWALRDLQQQGQVITTLVTSGGVASNCYLRTILRLMLNARKLAHVEMNCPPIELCTDNAAMIAWTGMEMYEQGWSTELSCHALRKWAIDPEAEDGGVMGATGWVRRAVIPRR